MKDFHLNIVILKFGLHGLSKFYIIYKLLNVSESHT